ncbi:RNA polymerase sigma factor [Phytoactinopolyspora halophila]|uniref:SigE family RNA polymerase sigma factor n=1 Tax=Phytoactinopolyspora halophila TaxID=1981511 RepID=A0A329R6H0_9ACTN|nr:sigma-70 family RNA polymerase sigma factor [Phytoactinopolyspora halophila]RAW18628.1 SigE family RNA polymerase sigma factor [Phytoactinopolyspora halophila]
MREELKESFTELVAAELTRLRRFAYGICGEWQRADDVVQAALERLYVAWPRVHDAHDPGAYARTVVARQAIDETRRPWRRWERTRDSVPERAARPDAADAVAGAADRLDLAQALRGLSAKQRAIVVLRFVEDRPVGEVAQILRIAPGTVKRQSHDALTRLRQTLTSNDDAGPGESASGRHAEGVE